MIKKTIRELHLQGESTSGNKKRIPEEIEAYFKNLHASNKTFSQEEYNEFTQLLQIPKLSNEDQDRYEECKKVGKMDLLSNFINSVMTYWARTTWHA